MLRTPRSSATAISAIAIAAVLLFIACQPDKSIQPRENRAPIAKIGGPRNGQEGAVLNLNAGSSEDPDGDTLTYSWDFGDGERGSGAVPEHVYRNDGSYAVSLTVRDEHGASDSVSTQARITNAPPVITMLVLPSTTVEVGSTAVITLGFSDPGVLDSLTAEVGWGDGTGSPVAYRTGTIGHIYAGAGNYLITLTVRDNDGAVTQKEGAHPIHVVSSGNHPPIARIQGPATGREGAVVLFSARQSTDPDGDALTYTWVLGDGRVFSDPSIGLVEQGWAYADDGSYFVSVIVADSHGVADTASTTISVANALPIVTGIWPPFQQAVGISATTRVAVSDSSSVDTLMVKFDWGDGASDSVVVEERWNAIGAHVYSEPGSYLVRATVRDDGGVSGASSASYRVMVFDPAERKSVAGYDVIDLGTLGGNSAKPADFNDRRQIVGSSRTSAGATHAFLWEDGVLRDLGTLGHPNSDAQRINDAGLVAGQVWSSERYDERASVATLWRGGSGRTIGNENPYGMSAVGVSTSEDVVWTRWGYESHHGWLWRKDVWELLSPTREARATAMNDHGQIVGLIATHSWGESRIFHAFLWEADSIRDLGVLGEFGGCDFDNCSWASPTDINESGQVVGMTSDSLGKGHFVLWENGTIRDLGLAASVYYEPSRVFINDRGQMAATAGGQALFWRNGGWQSLGTLGGSTRVVAMNEAGVVVGTSMTNGEQHVFLWSESRGMVDLGTGPHGFGGGWAVDINARGDIIGFTSPCLLNSYSLCDYPLEPRAVLWRKQ